MTRSPSPADLPADASAALSRWLDACAAAPGALPADCDLVHRRLVRAVGRGELPGVGTAFVKVMAFPRSKDRLRYAFRRLPAENEARALAELARRAPDLPCPEPLGVLASRAFGLPRLSVLVTRGLPLGDGDAPSLGERSVAAARLADVGIEHPDLHADNFVRLADGRVGVLDLQSARVRRAALDGSVRRGMAVKLIESAADDADLTALADSGLVPRGDLGVIAAAARRLRRLALVRRVRRCLQESSEFTVRRRLRGTLIARRAVDPQGWTELRDAAAPDLWLGDRTLEVLDGRPPVLAGLFVNRRWLPAPHSVYIAAPEPEAVFAQHRELLVAAHRRFRDLSAEARKR